MIRKPNTLNRLIRNGLRKQNKLNRRRVPTPLQYQSLETRKLLAADFSLVSESVTDVASGNDFYGFSMSVSDDGRYIAFESNADDLVPDDNNGFKDVFVRDVLLGVTTRVSTNYLGLDANDDTISNPTISADGRYVAFATYASDMLGPTGGGGQAYVRDMQLGTLTLVSPNYLTGDFSQSGGAPVVEISGNGQFVSFMSFGNDLSPQNTLNQLVVRNQATGEVSVASSTASGDQGNGISFQVPALSHDGRFVAFFSDSTSLGGDSSDGVQRLYRKDMLTGDLVNVAPAVSIFDNYSHRPSISDDGRFIAFYSKYLRIPGDRATSEVILADVELGTFTRVCEEQSGLACDSASVYPSISGDGTIVAFASSDPDIVEGDTNGVRDIFTWNRMTGERKRIATGFDGTQFNGHSFVPAISADGNYLAFQSRSSNITPDDTENMVDIFQTLIATNTIVQQRNIFYDNSEFSNSSLSDAIASDKSPLLPGQTASFENYSSSVNGINGLVIDVDSPEPTAITADDFVFRFGNEDDVSNWTQINPTVTVTVDEGGGNNGTDRVVLTFTDGEIVNGWLQTTMLANADTGLAVDDVFYFGNAIGDTGNSSTDARVNLLDVGLTRANQTGFTPATVNNSYDFNRDARVNLLDVAIARANQSGFDSLALITPTNASDRSEFSSKPIVDPFAIASSMMANSIAPRIAIQDLESESLPSQRLNIFSVNSKRNLGAIESTAKLAGSIQPLDSYEDEIVAPPIDGRLNAGRLNAATDKAIELFALELGGNESGATVEFGIH